MKPAAVGVKHARKSRSWHCAGSSRTSGAPPLSQWMSCEREQAIIASGSSSEEPGATKTEPSCSITVATIGGAFLSPLATHSTKPSDGMLWAMRPSTQRARYCKEPRRSASGSA